MAPRTRQALSGLFLAAIATLVVLSSIQLAFPSDSSSYGDGRAPSLFVLGAQASEETKPHVVDDEVPEEPPMTLFGQMQQRVAGVISSVGDAITTSVEDASSVISSVGGAISSSVGEASGEFQGALQKTVSYILQETPEKSTEIIEEAVEKVHVAKKEEL